MSVEKAFGDLFVAKAITSLAGILPERGIKSSLEVDSLKQKTHFWLLQIDRWATGTLRISARVVRLSPPTGVAPLWQERQRAFINGATSLR